MNLNFKKSKRIGIIIGIVLFIFLAVGVTYAVIAWRTTDYNVTLNSKCLVEGNFTKSENISGEDLLLIESQNIYLNQITIKKGMVLSNFSVWKDTTSDCTIDGYLRIALNVTNLPSAYMENGDSTNALQYALFYYDPEEYPSVNSNDLDGETFNTLTKGYITNTGLMEIYNDTIPDSGEKRNYILAIYLDGNLTHNNASDTNFSASVEASIEQKNGNIPLIEPLATDASFFEYDIVENTYATYTVTDQSACESYLLENNGRLSSEDAASLCSGGTWGPQGTLEDLIINESIPSSDYSAAGLSNVNIIENNEVAITGYKTTGTATYTVIDQSACESYLAAHVYNCGRGCDSYPRNVCSGGEAIGHTLKSLLISQTIPSSDYSVAGLSNVVITPAPTDVIIPSTIEGYPVTRIENYAFGENSLTSVAIPNTVTTIGESAFENAFNTSKDVILNIDMETIPETIFSNKGIKNLVLGNHVKSIGIGAFKSNQLTSVVIPNSVTSIGKSAFDGNPLTSITIENENITIGNCAFGTNPPFTNSIIHIYSCVPESISA